MKSFKKIFAGAVSALALVGSMQAQAGGVDNVSWLDGPLTIQGGFGKMFWANHDVTTGGALDAGGTFNMSDATIFRGGAFIQNTPGGPIGSGTVQSGDWFFAWGEMTSGLVSDAGYRLSYMIKGQTRNVSASIDSGKAVETGAFEPGLEILIFKSPNPPAFIGASGPNACVNTVTPSTCQASVDTANLDASGTLFLDLKATLVPPANNQTISEFTLTNNTVGSTDFLKGQSLAFRNSYFDVVGGTAAGYFAPSNSQDTGIVVGFSALEADVSNTSTGNVVGNPTGAKVVGFGLVLDTIPVPEPGSLALLGLSLVAAGFASRRRRA